MMGLVARLTTLAKADAHGVVDALEDKALVLRQHVREASAELDRKRCRIDALAAEDKDLHTDVDRIRQQMVALEDDVERALADDQDELARYAIKKLLPLRHRVARLERRIETIAEERTELEGQLAEQQVEFELLEQRVRGYLADCDLANGDLTRPGEPTHGIGVYDDWVVTDEDVELELLRRHSAGKGDG